MEKIARNYLTLHYPQWVYQPLNLTLEEINDPFDVIAAFFDCYTLHQSRLCLKRLLEDALNTENEKAINHLTFYDNILKLAEAAWLMLQRQPAIKKVLNTGTGDVAASFLNLIVAAIKPERVYLLRTNPLDFLIITADNAKRSLKEYEAIIELACINDETIIASVLRSSDLAKHLKEGNIFYSRTCVPKNVLYETSTASCLPSIPEALDKANQATRQQFETGFKRAEALLTAANYHKEGRENELAAFMLHQAAELSMRALVLALTGKEIRTHELGVLQKHCMRCAPKLKKIFLTDDNSDHLFTSLDKAYKDARYSVTYTVPDDEIELLKQKIAALLQEIKEGFNDFFSPAQQ